jgi:hypothetical protein
MSPLRLPGGGGSQQQQQQQQQQQLQQTPRFAVGSITHLPLDADAAAGDQDGLLHRDESGGESGAGKIATSSSPLLQERPVTPLDLGTPDMRSGGGDGDCDGGGSGDGSAGDGGSDGGGGGGVGGNRSLGSSSDDDSDAPTPRMSDDDRIRALTRTFVRHCGSALAHSSSNGSVSAEGDHPMLSKAARSVGQQIFALWE